MNRKTVFGMALGFLLIGTLMVTLNVQTAKGTGTIHKRADESVDPLGTTLVGGRISENTTWSLVGSPYTVIGDVVVDLDVFLTIEPGVVMQFNAGTNLVIDGNLIAHGNSTHRIKFTSSVTTPALGDWGAVNIRTGGSYKNVEWVIVEYSTEGIEGVSGSNIAESSFSDNAVGASGSDINLLLSNFTENGVGLSGSTIDVSQSSFLQNNVGLTGSKINVTSCLFNENSNGISAAETTIDSSEFFNNTIGISGSSTVTNCQVTYNKATGISGAILVENTTVTHNGGDGIGSGGIVENCTISGNNGNGVSANRIYNCTIHDNGGIGANVLGLKGEMLDSSVSANLGGGVFVYSASSEGTEPESIINNSRITGNLFGIKALMHGRFESAITVNNSDIINNFDGGIISAPIDPDADLTVSLRIFNSVIDSNGLFGIRMNDTAWSDDLGEILLPVRQVTNCRISNQTIGGIGSFGTISESTISNSLIGLSGSVGTVSGCTISNNTIGLKGSVGAILDSIVSNNSVGVNGTIGVVSGSVIESNSQIGLDVFGLTGNICWNNIYDNGIYNIRNHVPYGTDLNATHNWWGTIDQLSISEHIYDYYDDYTLSRVLYNPSLDQPITEDQIAPHIVDVAQAPTTPNYYESVTVSATITDNVEVNHAILSYTGNLVWHNISMNNFDNVFNTTIPAQPYGSNVQYRIYANDTNGNWAESGVFSYTVGDAVPPEILNVEWTPTCPNPYRLSNVTRQYEPTAISVNVTEPANASGVSSVLFSYSANGVVWNASLAFNSTTCLWSVEIPGYAANTHIEFSSVAYDNIGNSRTSSVYSFDVQQLPIGDVNGDGIVNILDAIILSNHYLQHYP